MRGPVLERDHERVLERFFREVEVVQRPDEPGQHEPRLLAEHSLDGRARVFHAFSLAERPSPGCRAYESDRIGRISIEPFSAPGMPAAISMAASRSAHSMR